MSSIPFKVPDVGPRRESLVPALLSHTCYLCLSESSKLLWGEGISTHDKIGDPSGKGTSLRSHSHWHHIWDPNLGLCPAETEPQPRTTWWRGSPQATMTLCSREPFHQVDTMWVVRFLCNSHAVVTSERPLLGLTWLSFIVFVWHEFNSQLKKKKDIQKVSFIWLHLQKGGFQGRTWLWRHWHNETGFSPELDSAGRPGSDPGWQATMGD